jgi:Asp-tRNA(Asn)/Glu-tRNA(Gln) amidotransferase A subunit family amidase
MAGLVALGAYTLLRAVARNAPLYSRAARRVFTSGAARATVKRKRAEVASAVADAEAWLAEAGGAPMPELRAAVSRSTIDELVRLQSHGMVTALDILKCFVANAIASHRRTNCLTFIDARAAAVAAARADEYRRAGNALPPLHGIPVSVKENMNLVGTDSTLGVIRHAGHPQHEDAGIIILIRQAGGIVFAKTNVPQTLMSFECSNFLFGKANNPHNLAYTCGGSSGGEAVLVADGGSGIGIGTDVGGSIRIPAHFCGVVGFKPSQWRVPVRGIRSSLPGQEAVPSVAGPIARCVADAVTMMRVLVNGNQLVDGNTTAVPFRDEVYLAAQHQKGVTFGYYVDDGFVPASPACARAVRVAVAALERAGHRCVPMQPGGLGPASVELFYQLLSADGGETIENFVGAEALIPQVALLVRAVHLPHWLKQVLSVLAARVDPALGMLLAATAPRTVAQYWQLQAKRQAVRHDVMRAMAASGVDCVLSPGLAVPAMKHDASVRASWGSVYTSLLNLTDSPSVAVPVTRVDRAVDEWPAGQGCRHPVMEAAVRAMYDAQAMHGLPVGVQLYGLKFQDERVLGYAVVLENALKETQ